MALRPDERANQAEIERDENFRSTLKSGASTIAGAAVGAGSGLASKVLPFLSEYIPSDLAMRGIDKVAPKLGAFLRRGQGMGLDIKEGFDYLREQITPKEDPGQAKESRNLVEQYDPELHTYITEKIKSGLSHIKAGTKALGHDRFKKAIKRIEKDHGTTWDKILDAVYGGQKTQKQTPQQQQTPQPPTQPPIEPNKQVQSTAGQDRLMAALQKLQKIRGSGGP